jgi:hypothetical protein
MNTAGIVAKFKKERNKLLRDLAKIDGVLTALGHSARGAYEKERKKHSHNRAAKAAISRRRKRDGRKSKPQTLVSTPISQSPLSLLESCGHR